KNITIAELFKYPSVRELCSYLAKETWVGKTTDYSESVIQRVNAPEEPMDEMSVEDIQRFISGECVDI
ncbi:MULTISPECIES: hypothetical protein, partial [unclassified Serratia (in: enterobacteria)]|uniref:hypothetical protein n=1 Tax=unclassified Serratia (in: enterobacteria) TaxID=2647522 RepID=UPI00056202D0